MSTADNPTSSKKIHYCPSCRKPLRPLKGKLGPFWGCTGFPQCKTTLNDLGGKPSTEVDEQYRCPSCTRRLVRADKGSYWFCSGYNKGCKVILADDNGTPETAHRCPSCNHLLVKRQGKHGLFWGCSDYPRYKTSLSDSANRPDFDLFAAKRS
jgi:ssDNA-binding Zn-finger/Zn-ribbon topoisomerase 1